MRMKSSLVLAAVLLLSAWGGPGAASDAVVRVERGNLVIEGIPEVPGRVTERMRPYQSIRSASFQGWDPAGKGILIATRFSETSQIHQVAEPGGARSQITFFDEPIGNAVPSPNAEVHGFIFPKDVGGGEFYQLFFHDSSTGRDVMLTDGASRNGSAVWADGGRRFAFYTTRRNGHDWDIHLADIREPGRSTALVEREGAWIAVDWSPDDTKLLVMKLVSANENYLHVVDVATGELTQVNPTGEKVSYGEALFSRDGKGIWLTSDQGSEFKRLQYFDLATKGIRVVTGDTPWDVSDFSLSKDGRRLAWVVNEDGIAKLHVMDPASAREETLPRIPVGEITGLAFDERGDRLGMTLNTPQTPGDVYSVDFASSRLTRWTTSEVGGLDAARFVTPELVHYPTFDTVDGKAREIPAFYYKPEGKGPFPVIVSIHGGPEGQARPFFSSTIQYWVNELGIAVITPNVRGSSGYGKSYLRLDNGFDRESSVKDIGTLLDWVATRPELDKDRTAVYGGSYGGYMVLASMVHFNDRLRAGVDIVGISNFLSFLRNTKDYRRDLRRVEYGDERDVEMSAFLDRISPANNAKKITKPMFIAQGLNDPRVPVGESEQMVEVIRSNGGTVWYLLAKDEGHGFRKKGNSDFYQAAVSLFLERYLLDGRTTEG